MPRGWNEEVLTLTIEADAETASPNKPVERMIAVAYEIGNGCPGDRWLMEVASWTWRVKLSMSLSPDLMRELRERAEEEAIHVFARNFGRDLLLAALPARARPWALIRVSARRQGRRHRCHRQGGRDIHRLSLPAPQRRARCPDRARLADPQAQCRADLDRNGTGSRETEKLVADMLADLLGEAHQGHRLEAGASVYSRVGHRRRRISQSRCVASAAPSPSRAACRIRWSSSSRSSRSRSASASISIDVDQQKLSRSLDAVVEDAVNAVGVDLNMAFVPLFASCLRP